MADKLKDFFNEDIVCAIAADLHRAYPPLKTTPFVAACMKGLEDLELTERAWHIAEVMHDHLPSPFAAAARVIIDSLPPPLASTETFGMAPFRYAPHTFFVQKYGLDDFEAAVQAQYELTQRFSANGRAIRVRTSGASSRKARARVYPGHHDCEPSRKTRGR